MPRNMMSDFAGMVCEIPPEVKFASFEKAHCLESGKSRPRRRSSTLQEEDDALKYLTHEEKDVLLFFEETIDSLEVDLEEQALHDSGIHCHSPRSVDETLSSHSDSEEIIDLVRSAEDRCPRRDAEPVEEIWQPGNAAPEYVEPLGEDSVDRLETSPVLPSAPPLPIYEVFPAPPPVQHPKLLRSIPTPLVIAQKISENQVEGSSFLPVSPKDRGSSERRSVPASPPLHDGERCTALKQLPAPATAPKPLKFPSNISITNASEREFSKTISKAAVNVQERKAQVLANVNGSAFLINEFEERLPKRERLGHSRSSSLRDLPSEQARPEALSRLVVAERNLCQTQLDSALSGPASNDEKPEQARPVSNGYQNIHEILKRESTLFPSVSKTVTFKPDADLVDGKPARQKESKSFHEHDHRQPDFSLDLRRRSGSLPRPSGLRPQGVTVQFSGRGSSEEARREALRKLGLLKE